MPNTWASSLSGRRTRPGATDPQPDNEMSSENDTDTPADRQSRIDRALSVPAEQPGKPENWRKRLYAHADKLAEALMQIDEQISDVNQMLHRTQGPRAGKISVRFLCLQRLDRNMDNRDRIPVAVSWYGPKGQAAKRYKMLPRGEKYFSLRRRGENDQATRQLLRMLNSSSSAPRSRPAMSGSQPRPRSSARRPSACVAVWKRRLAPSATSSSSATSRSLNPPTLDPIARPSRALFNIHIF